jgi:hypothetical protein
MTRLVIFLVASSGDASVSIFYLLSGRQRIGDSLHVNGTRTSERGHT